MITLAELRKIMPFARARADVFVNHLNSAMAEFEINNPLREAAFLAQVAHESGELCHAREGLIVGIANYRDCSAALFGDPDLLLRSPERLEDPEVACRSAAWLWSWLGLNALADKGDFLRVTKVITGGTTRYKERVAYYERAKEVFSSEVS